MVNVWRSNYDPYDTTVYDEKYYRERHCELIRQFEKERKEAIDNLLEEMREEGLLNKRAQI